MYYCPSVIIDRLDVVQVWICSEIKYFWNKIEQKQDACIYIMKIN